LCTGELARSVVEQIAKDLSHVNVVTSHAREVRGQIDHYEMFAKLTLQVTQNTANDLRQILRLRAEDQALAGESRCIRQIGN